MSRISTWATMLALALLTSGCAPARPPVPQLSPSHAAPVVPVTGMCFRYWRTSDPADWTSCTTQHLGEVIAVQTGHGIPSDRAAIARAYADCYRHADAYLGGPWWQQRVDVQVRSPDRSEQQAGMQWYRCDLFELAQLTLPSGQTLHKQRAAPLSTAAAPELRHVHCAQLEGDVTSLLATSLIEVECKEPHNAELAGFVRAPDELEFPTVTRLEGREIRNKLSARCRSSIGRFVSDTSVKYTVWVAPTAGEVDWQQGNRGVRCFVWLDGRSVTGSLHR